MTAYTLYTPAAGARPLIALSLAELAELIECALIVGDPIDAIAASTYPYGVRTLTVAETHRLVDLLVALDG